MALTPTSDSPSSGPHERLLAHVRALLERSISLKRQVLERESENIVSIAGAIAASLNRGGKVLFCGNGGSAADAQHLAAELLVRLTPQLNRRPLPAISLAADVPSLTACANDYSFDEYFARMTEALGAAGDVLVGISTSGKSPGVVQALRAARRKGMLAVGLLGGDGTPALEECDLALVVPSHETGRVQEAHIAIGHAMMEVIEDLCIVAQPADPSVGR